MPKKPRRGTRRTNTTASPVFHVHDIFVHVASFLTMTALCCLLLSCKRWWSLRWHFRRLKISRVCWGVSFTCFGKTIAKMSDLTPLADKIRMLTIDCEVDSSFVWPSRLIHLKWNLRTEEHTSTLMSALHNHVFPSTLTSLKLWCNAAPEIDFRLLPTSLLSLRFIMGRNMKNSLQSVDTQNLTCLEYLKVKGEQMELVSLPDSLKSLIWKTTNFGSTPATPITTDLQYWLSRWNHKLPANLKHLTFVPFGYSDDSLILPEQLESFVSGFFDQCKTRFDAAKRLHTLELNHKVSDQTITSLSFLPALRRLSISHLSPQMTHVLPFTLIELHVPTISAQVLSNFTNLQILGLSWSLSEFDSILHHLPDHVHTVYCGNGNISVQRVQKWSSLLGFFFPFVERCRKRCGFVHNVALKRHKIGSTADKWSSWIAYFQCRGHIHRRDIKLTYHRFFNRCCQQVTNQTHYCTHCPFLLCQDCKSCEQSDHRE